MIKYSHTHTEEGKEGVQCFLIHPSGGRGRYENACLLQIDGVQYTAAYYTFTWTWKIWDFDGREVATCRREFFETVYGKFRTGNLEETKGEC